jgi:hypothetical protein
MRVAHHRRSIVMSFALALAVTVGGVTRAEAAGVEPARATPVQREQAQGRFLKGRELYNRKKYEAALVELNASLDIVASPNTRLYIGRCLREMGRTVAAYVELGRAAVEAKELLRDDNRYEKAAQAANEERAALAPKLGFVEVTVTHASAATTMQISGEEVRRGGWTEPFPVLPGTSEIVVETAGHAPIKQEVQVVAGEHKAVTIDAGADGTADAVATNATATGAPSRSESKFPKLPPAAYATGGLAVVGLATFVIAGLKANSTYSKLESDCGSGPCPPGHDSDISAGKTQQTVANIGLVVFLVSGAATVTLFVLSKDKTPASASSSLPRVSARVTAGPSFVGLQGGF